MTAPFPAGELATPDDPGEFLSGVPLAESLPLDQAPKGYDMFKNKHDACIKVVLKPHEEIRN